MITGSKLVAPEGFKCLEKDKLYYFLHSDGGANRVFLVEFLGVGEKLSSSLVTLTRLEFEEALEDGVILEDGVADSPPWLEQVASTSIAHRESLRVSAGESYDEKVNRRFAKISGLVLRLDEILGSAIPDAIINADAKAQRPEQNAARLRLWFYTYIVFGHNKWALMPLFHGCGGWNRDDPSYRQRLGRPSPKGKNCGYRSNPSMVEKIIKGWVAHKDPTKTANTIYREILTREFGCIAVMRDKNKFEFAHPRGEPFPTPAQVRYQVEKFFSSKQRSTGVRGLHKTKAISGSKGSFSDKLFNVYQSVEFDGYNLSEKLSGITEGSAVDGFCVVRATCGVSGMVLGVGFAEGKENMKAYEMCLYSMATDKVKFCELFGIKIEPHLWPGVGLPGGVIFDRGPGATYDVEPQIDWLRAFELTPVFSGQSKATVESSHRRNKKTLDQPTHFHSGLNFVQMSIREIMRVLEDNQTSDASRRLDEELVLAGVKPTPLSIFSYWSGRGRNSAQSMQPNVAIKKFLDKHPATIRKDAVYFYGRKYRSAALVATGVFDRVARQGTIQTTAYILTMCVRHIWIEVNGEVFELDFLRPVRTAEGSADISLKDLQLIQRLRLEGVTALRDETPAIQQYFRDWFKRLTGEDGDAGVRSKGRPTKGAPSQRDKADFGRFVGKTA
jgi:hypothetical protein